MHVLRDRAPTPFFLQHQIMLPQRTPLRNIDGNRRGRGPNLTPYDRGQISGMYQCGKTPTEIEAELGYL